MNKLEFKVKALETIDEIYGKIENLDRKKDSLNENLKKEYDKQLHVLKERKAELEEKIDAFEKASEDKRGAIKEKFSEALKLYKTGFDKLSTMFK